MKRIDVAAWTGIWPFTMSREADVAEVIGGLREVGVDGALVSPLNSILGPDPMLANRDLLAACRDLAGSFQVRVAPMLDPTLPGWEQDLAMLAADPMVAGVRLVPSYHGYPVDGAAVESITRFATDLRLPVCVQVRIIDERAHHPLMLVPAVQTAAIARLAQAVPTAKILASGAFQSDLAALAACPNVAAELSSIESADTLANAVAVLGSERLMLGTHVPVYTPAPGVAKVDEAADALVFDRIAVGNARTWFGFS